jgi:hypothetical protein
MGAVQGLLGLLLEGRHHLEKNHLPILHTTARICCRCCRHQGDRIEQFFANKRLFTLAFFSENAMII